MALSRKKKIIIGVSALVVLVLVIVISVLATRKDQPKVTTVKVDVRPELKSTVTASGEVRPVRYIKLTSEVPGRILEIYVNPGDIVKQRLKRTTELIEKGVASRYDYDAAHDRYDQTKIALETAKSNLESQKLAVKEAQERANQQRTTIKEAQTGIKSSEMRASQQQA